MPQGAGIPNKKEVGGDFLKYGLFIRDKFTLTGQMHWVFRVTSHCGLSYLLFKRGVGIGLNRK